MLIDKALNDAFVAGKSKQPFESFKAEWLGINSKSIAELLKAEQGRDSYKVKFELLIDGATHQDNKILTDKMKAQDLKLEALLQGLREIAIKTGDIRIYDIAKGLLSEHK